MLSTLSDSSERGFLDGQCLIAMPGMRDINFARSVVYVCAHSSAGAMGFVINRQQSVSFPEVLTHLDLMGRTDAVMASAEMRAFPVLTGGPVETGRGFVLHTDDYASESSIPISEEISLTATLDILRAIREGHGPRKAVLLLGYAGWGPGQLEVEITGNGWLNCPATDGLIFDHMLEAKYEKALALLGVRPEALSTDAGHA